MYLAFHGLTEKPFNNTPDPRFLHLTKDQREALAQLVYCVKERTGFMVLTGEVGTGKTTLLRALLRQLDPGAAVAFVFNSTLPFDGILEQADAFSQLSERDPVDRRRGRASRRLLEIGKRFLLDGDDGDLVTRPPGGVEHEKGKPAIAGDQA